MKFSAVPLIYQAKNRLNQSSPVVPCIMMHFVAIEQNRIE